MENKGYYKVRRYDAKGLSLGARMLYVTLCDLANYYNEEWFFASNAKLAAYMDVSEKSLKNYKKELRDRDDLVQMKRGDAKIIKNVTYYKIVDETEAAEPENPFKEWC